MGSISALLADYFEHHGLHLATKTLRGYQETAARHVIPRLGFVPTLSLTTQEVRQTLTEVSHSAPQMARQVKKVLSGAFEYGIAHVPGVTVNPCLGIKVTVPFFHHAETLAPYTVAALGQLAGPGLVPAFYAALDEVGPLRREELTWDAAQPPHGNWRASGRSSGRSSRGTPASPRASGA